MVSCQHLAAQLDGGAREIIRLHVPMLFMTERQVCQVLACQRRQQAMMVNLFEDLTLRTALRLWTALAGLKCLLSARRRDAVWGKGVESRASSKRSPAFPTRATRGSEQVQECSRRADELLPVNPDRRAADCALVELWWNDQARVGKKSNHLMLW